MNILIPLVVLLIIGIIYVYTQPQKNRLLGILAIIAVVIFVFLLDMKDNFIDSMPAPLDYSMGACSNMDLSSSNANRFMWNYDNLKLKAKDPNEPNCPYQRVPCNSPLISDVTIFSPVGDGIKLTEDVNAASFPTVDGTPNTPHHLFMLAHNMTSPLCCPSTFSTDRGCVCLTKEQRDLINSRGTNRQAPDEF